MNLAALEPVIEQFTEKFRSLKDRLDRFEGQAGLTFFRENKDNDGDYDPLTAAGWEAATPAATGTINWNTVFGVPKRARAVLVYVSGTISFKAKSSTTNGAAMSGEQRTVMIADDGTSYWYGASGTVTVRVIGWWA